MKNPIRSKEHLRPKPSQRMPLHKWIALGGNPKDYEGCKGVNSETVNKIPRKKNY